MKSLSSRFSKTLCLFMLKNSHRLAISVGLISKSGAGDMFVRDGLVMKDPVQVDQEWQVHNHEEVIFQSACAPQYPKKWIMLSPDKKEGFHLGETLARETAEHSLFPGFRRPVWIMRLWSHHVLISCALGLPWHCLKVSDCRWMAESLDVQFAYRLKYNIRNP